jgi:uncharacterized protein YraI
MVRCLACRAVTLFVLICCVFSLADTASYVVVSNPVARVLVLPHGDSKSLGFVQKGDRFKILTKTDEWYHIEFKNSVGWIFQDYVKVEKGSEPPRTAANVPASSVPQKPPSPAPAVAAASPQKMPPAAPPTVQTLKPQQAQPAPVQPSPAPSPVQPVFQASVKQTEKTEAQAMQADQTQKKLPSKSKHPQNVSIDLPPAQVSPLPEVKQPQAAPGAAATVPQTTETPSAPQAKPRPQPAVPQKVPEVSAQPEPGKKYLEIIESSVKILSYVSPESPMIGMARKNECYPLLHEGESWCKIQFGKDTGWVERRMGKIVDSPTTTAAIPRIVLVSSIGAGALLLIVIVVILVVRSTRIKKERQVTVRKDLLIIAGAEKEIQYSLSDSTIPLSKCFSEIGFHIDSASDLEQAKNLLAHYLPDVIVVDWQLDANIQQSMESVLSNRTSTSNILVIFYNVPSPSTSQQSLVIPNAHFLGFAFSDRDIFRLVTPLIITQSGTKTIRKSVESAALGGDISQGNLLEVFQFIEIGRKTGCLYIVLDKPFGLIYFSQGRLTYATSPTQQGKEAVFEILNCKTGRFHFVADKVSQTKNIDLSTLEILMEWTKNQDEAHRV